MTPAAAANLAPAAAANPAPAKPEPALEPAPSDPGRAPYPVASLSTPDSAGRQLRAQSSAFEPSSLMAAAVAVGAVLGSGALLGLMLRTGARRRRRPDVPSAGGTRPHEWSPLPGLRGAGRRSLRRVGPPSDASVTGRRRR